VRRITFLYRRVCPLIFSALCACVVKFQATTLRGLRSKPRWSVRKFSPLPVVPIGPA
jgi:hypothetical protein